MKLELNPEQKKTYKDVRNFLMAENSPWFQNFAWLLIAESESIDQLTVALHILKVEFIGHDLKRQIDQSFPLSEEIRRLANSTNT